jgi:hypothetical protein
MELGKPWEEGRSSKLDTKLQFVPSRRAVFSVRYKLVDAAGCFKNHTKKKIHWLQMVNTNKRNGVRSAYFETCDVWARSQNCEKRLLASLCLSVRMEQLGSHWTDFHEILYLSIFRKSVKKIRVSLISDKNNG